VRKERGTITMGFFSDRAAAYDRQANDPKEHPRTREVAKAKAADLRRQQEQADKQRGK
jgi:hypothetical protein